MTTPTTTAGYVHPPVCTEAPPRRRGGQPLTTAMFVSRALERHAGRYDYNQVTYRDSRTPVTITCPDHGSFHQTPNNHLHGGRGCPACGRRNQAVSRWDTTTFIALARAVHGDRWDYSASEACGINVKVAIGCPEHGTFLQTPNNHIHSKAGCPRCGARAGGLKTALTQGEFVAAARLVHGDKYGFELARYVGAMEKVELVCGDHTFWMAANGFLSGYGCARCYYKGKSLTRENFTLRATDLFDGKYDYSLVTGEFVPTRSHVTILCPAHGAFSMPAGRHLMGGGCSGCSESHGERAVRKVLVAASIPFISEWGHPTLRHRAPLRFDFMLPTLRTLIEFDGEFHRRPVQ